MNLLESSPPRLRMFATDNPQINVARVKHRFKNGGHDVPVEKITSRYFRSLDNLRAAIES